MDISGPTIHPFTQRQPCRSCGFNMPFVHRFKQWLLGTSDSHVNHGYCPGAKEPTQDGTVVTVTGPVPVTQRWICAGIYKPHLHCTCRNCGLQWITETRQVISQ